MKDIVRQSLYKICSTLVKADRVITVEEAEKLQKICEDYEINLMDRAATLGMSLSEAFHTLAQQKPKLRREVLNHLQNLSLSDGSCCKEEALLLLAAEYCLGGEEEPEHTVVSSPCEGLELEDSQVIYLENQYDADTNDFIQTHYRRISDALHVGGFDFIYIPKIAQQYQQTDAKLVQNLIGYLAPSLSQQDSIQVQETLNNLSTAYFKNELLYQKFGVRINAPEPIFLIKVGNSFVSGIRHADFLCLRTSYDLMEQLETLIDRFIALQNSPMVTIQKSIDKGEDFIYTGFYKTLFDMVTLRRGLRNALIIQPYSHAHILSVNSPENRIDMGPKEAAFYVLLTAESLNDSKGINFNLEGKIYLKYLDYIQKRYATIYSRLTGKDNAPDITDWKIRNPIVSKVKKAIRENELITDQETFLPQERGDEALSVSLETTQIFVWQDRKLVNVKDSELLNP